MIVLKVRDEESDDDSLAMPEWMNHPQDVYSDDGDASSDADFEISSDSSDSSSEDEWCGDEDKEQENEANKMDESAAANVTNDSIPNSCPSSVQSSLSENEFDSEGEPQGYHIFPASYFHSDMDVSDDDEAAIARDCYYSYLEDKGYVSFSMFRPSDCDADSEETAAGTGCCSGVSEGSKSPDDSSAKTREASSTDKPDTTSRETAANISTPLDA